MTTTHPGRIVVKTIIGSQGFYTVFCLSVSDKPPISSIPVIVVILLVALGVAVAAAAFLIWFKKRKGNGE